MTIISNEAIAKYLEYEKLIEALFEMFCSDYHMPLRHHHFYPVPGGEENTLILMPSWNDRYLGIKQIVLAPGNTMKGLATVSALYTLFDVETGRPLALLDAEEITSRRTACTSALAARYLAPQDASILLIVGGGRVAQHLIPAHAAVRHYQKIYVWMRNPSKYKAFAEKMPAHLQPLLAFAGDLESAARTADVISTATMTIDPIIEGAWLKDGVYLDLIGSYKPNMREVDDDAISKCNIFVDSRMGALHEAGELAIPLANGLIAESDVVADLTELCNGFHGGRKNNNENILFKSAGLAIEDLAGAQLVYKLTSAI